MITDKSSGTCNLEYCNLKYNNDILEVNSYSNTKNQSIKRTDIGTVSSEFRVQLPHNTFTYSLRFLLGGLLIGVISLIISAIGFDLLSDIISIIMWISLVLSAILYAITILDAMIGSKMGFKLLLPIFGSEGNRIIIKNTNSINALEFYVGRGQVKMLEKFIDKARLEPSATVNNSSNAQSTSLDELEKLANLRDKGIITEEEFNIKKKNLLEL